MFILALNASVMAGSVSPPKNPVEKRNIPARDAATEARIETLERRLHEIEKMDFSKLERAKKSEVKKELREIRRELKAYNASGIYISLGGLLIIVLLLILLL